MLNFGVISMLSDPIYIVASYCRAGYLLRIWYYILIAPFFDFPGAII